MANRYWVGGSGTWDAASTTHWSASSGGANGASAPTSIDDVFIDSSSGLSGGIITLGVSSALVKNITSSSGFLYTITGTSEILSYGNLTLESGITIAGSWDLALFSTAAGNTITSSGVVFNKIQVVGVGGEWILQDDLTISGEFYQENGTFRANGHNVATNDFYFYADVGFTPTVDIGYGIWTPGRSSWTLDQNNGVTVTIISSWTKVSKPTNSNWTAASGRYAGYDDPNITYDQVSIYYDGANPNAWTKVNKPATSSWTKIAKPT